MKISIGDIRLFFDIEGGSRSVVNGRIVQKPTLLLLHGGPGIDHNYFRPAMSELAQDMQVIYLDHRGHGQSDRGHPDQWNLKQWADDVSNFANALELDKVVLFGNSFGGFVAQKIALMQPKWLDKLILSSTMATFNAQRIIGAFGKAYGEHVQAAAEAFWSNPCDEDVRQQYRQICGSYYNTTPQNRMHGQQIIRNDAILEHFYRPNGEGRQFNFLGELYKITVPTLVLGGKKDPVSTPEDAEDLMNALPSDLSTLALIEDSGHGPFRDDAAATFRNIRHFVFSS